jgi:TonB-linked SusC/RagA family outer membrane protein
MLMAVTAFAQNLTVRGVVKDATGAPVIGAGVFVTGTTNGAVSDENGAFVLNNVPSGSTLTATCLGYADQQKPAAAQVEFLLQEDVDTIEETVVVGYGSVKKSNLSGAVSSVKPDELPTAGNASVGSMMRGRAAGMNITSSNAAPGSALNITVRGGLSGASPLIVIDGVPQVASSRLSSGTYSGSSKDGTLVNINPNDIESIDILKDASSAAIYGSNASGGVILITTKRGREGQARVSYSSSASASWIKDAPDFLNAKDFMIEQNKVFDELGRSSEKKWTQEQIDAFVGDGTDWMKEVTRIGLVHEHNISVTAGSNATRALFSGSFYDHDGIAKNNDMQRITGRMNIDQDLNRWMTVGVSTNYTRIRYNDVPLGNARHDNSALIYSAMTFIPTVPVYNLDGSFSDNPIRPIYPNPVSLLDVINTTMNQTFGANAYIQARPFDGLTLRVTAGVDIKDGQTDSYTPRTTKKGYATDGAASKQNGKNNMAMINAVATYAKVFGKHDVNVMGGWEYKKNFWEGMGIYATQFPFDNALYNNIGSSTQESPSISSNKGSSEMASFFARANYVLNGKYILTANVRVDGSSNFSPAHQWGVFPGVSLAWKMNEEPWLQNVSWLSSLKLRAGAGQTGNAGGLTGIYSYYTVRNNVFAPGGSMVNGVGLSKIGNPNLKWETLTDYNIGVDFGFFRNRINGTIDAYERYRSDIIQSKSLMSYNEIRTIDYNSQQVYRSRGIDFTLRSVNIDSHGFYWATDFNISFNRNHTLTRDPEFIPSIYQPMVEDWGNVYGYVTLGLIQSGESYAHLPNSRPGCINYLDRSGYMMDDQGNRLVDKDGRYIHDNVPDGLLDAADMVLLFNNAPIPVGLNNTFRYKNLDLNVYVYGSLHTRRVNDVKYQSVWGIEDITYGVNALTAIKNRWSESNPTGTMPAVYEANTNINPSSFFYEKSWYLRLDNISLGYTFPARWLKNKIRSFRAYVSTRNIAVLTPYTGMDPETGNGIGAYPNNASAAIGIDIKF